MPEIEVTLERHSYPILIEPGALGKVGTLVAERLAPQSVLVVSHPQIAARHGRAVMESLAGAGVSATMALVPPGDRTKSLRMASRLIDQAIACRLERSSAILALGGGVVGDLAGFVASIYLRGVAFVQVPTSLLAQVDASVGGKTAVNHPAGKNLIGSFYQPRLVVIDPHVLQTLPRRELRSGLAEMIKHGVILDANYFQSLEATMPLLLRRDPEALTDAILGSCRLKAGIVATDEREAGLRALLNYGHTFGHALEAVTGFRRYKHGEAVSIGMEMAAMLAQQIGVLAEGEADRQRALLRAAGLPVALRGRMAFNTEALLTAMQMDKKVSGGRNRFVLARRIGEGFVASDVPPDAVRAVCERFLG